MNIYLQAVMWTVFACFAVAVACGVIAMTWSFIIDKLNERREYEYHRTKNRVAADLRYYSCWLSTSDDAMHALECFANELEQPTRFDMGSVREAWENKTGRRDQLGRLLKAADRVHTVE